jgi:hypothetical protein
MSSLPLRAHASGSTAVSAAPYLGHPFLPTFPARPPLQVATHDAFDHLALLVIRADELATPCGTAAAQAATLN